MLKGRRARGAATVEFHIVALLAVLPLCLGIVQMALLMVENHHIDHAAFMAARQGAVTQGDPGAMRRAFASAVTPLLVSAASPVNRSNVVARVAEAYARAAADVALHARLRVVSPSADAQADFAITREGRRVIPNDALAYRSMSAGSRSGQSIQEANLLRLEVRYCRPLVVPLVSTLLLATLRSVDTDAWNQRCYAAGRVPIRSEGIAPMQSDFRVSS
jgi:Flp pilus assembly protein TadG